MLLQVLTDHLWVALLIWVTVYALDYAMTIRGARLYDATGKTYVTFEGSYELTPYYQKDIDALRPVSIRFVVMLGVSSVAIGLVWLLSIRIVFIPQAFSFLMGGLLLRQAVVLMRHANNIWLYRYFGKQPDDVQGHIHYGRRVVLRRSAFELASFAALYLLLFAVVGEWFFAGGAFACLAMAFQHGRLARRPAQGAPPQPKSSSERRENAG